MSKRRTPGPSFAWLAIAVPGAVLGAVLALVVVPDTAPDAPATFASARTALGALIGALTLLPVVWIAARLARGRTRERAAAAVAPATPPTPPGAHAAAIGLGRIGSVPRTSPRTPTHGEAWLHLVAGPNGDHIALGLMEAAAPALARGERVLMIDGTRRAHLHETFGGEARWGLVECLEGDLPVLGLVQAAGHSGLYLLAHGHASRAEEWPQLGRRLEEARPHFGRVVLALDPATPSDVGDALAGRLMEAWWSDAPSALSGDLPKPARALSERIAIAFQPMALPLTERHPLERLAARVDALGATREASPVALTAPLAIPERVDAIAAAPDPAVVDCDLQVRERLRFLVWMRRVQAERRREVLETAQRP